jgi:hypothetical protein
MKEPVEMAGKSFLYIRTTMVYEHIVVGIRSGGGGASGGGRFSHCRLENRNGDDGKDVGRYRSSLRGRRLSRSIRRAETLEKIATKNADGVQRNYNH